MAKIAIAVKEVTQDNKHFFERMETDVQKSNKREMLKMKWKLKMRCDKEPSSHYRVNRSGTFAMPRGKGRGNGNEKVRERETDRRV